MTHQEDSGRKAHLLSGWLQFTTQKIKMLNSFQESKELSSNRPTKTDSGRCAEALFREWLEQYLPAKYGVTSGYIIQQSDAIKPAHELRGKLRHYDVIIYNRLESCILWSEDNPDHSLLGKARAIPAEHVHAVLEIKSTFNARSITNAFKKLSELSPYFEKVDEGGEYYKDYFPENFFMGMVFFELPKKEQCKVRLIDRLVLANALRGFSGGIILSADGISYRNTGWFTYYTDNRPIPLSRGRSLTENGILSDSMELSPGRHTTCMLTWSAQGFALFANELVSKMNGTYPGRYVPSWHGLNFVLGQDPQ